MSFRTQIGPFKAIDAESMGASINGAVTIIEKATIISYQFIYTGTPNGTLSIQVSNDYSLNPDGSVANTGTWSTISVQNATSALVASVSIAAAGNTFVQVQACGAYAIRPVFTRSSGTGSLTAIVTGKVA